ncbi:MAG: 23S rRNA (uracil(1939)-C(5))-methyltransferase RlmD [Chloroflexi bacterium]|nr:23S rRNA (uracil(1939)-C(5))-methyltransferase RlmD [Chloroflexota bacterium]
MVQQNLSAGERIELRLTSWGRLGEAMASYVGHDVFVLGGIPGERVIAEVVRVRRKYVAAIVVEVLVSSPVRIAPPCPYYGFCTGCQWQHVDYEAQLDAKRDKVSDALKRVGGMEQIPVEKTLPSPVQYGYRNHARFTVGKSGDLGFVNRETRQFIHIDRCMLMHDGINHILEELQDRCSETTQLAVRAGRDTGDYLVQPPLKNPEISIPTGQKHYQESVSGRAFRVASPSFFQVNVDQAAQLIEVVRNTVGLSGNEVLLDAYTGVGTFAVLLAPFARQVYAIEESSAAVEDARQNAAGVENLGFLLGKTEDVLADLPQSPDIVILDPPRAGCQPSALAKLLDLKAPKIVYVSCDPETLARDLKVLCADSYSVVHIQPVDMFPQTQHVECVAVLTLSSSSPLILASGSPRRRELLTELGLKFEVRPSNAPEEQIEGETAEEMVQRLSRDKAMVVAADLTEGFVIGADSTVVLEGRSIGKPEDEEDARRMLMELRGTEHQVTTGLTVVNVATGRLLTEYMTAEIVMRNFTEEEMEQSIASGTPMDKAGAYAVQDTEFRPATLQGGCYTNVVGLPLCRLMEMLEELGYEALPDLKSDVGSHCLGSCPFRGCGEATQ